MRLSQAAFNQSGHLDDLMLLVKAMWQEGMGGWKELAGPLCELRGL